MSQKGAILQPSRSFIVYSGHERYPRSEGVEAIPLADLCDKLGRVA